MTQPSVVCPRCGYTSFLLSDVKHGWCPQCAWWTSDPTLGSVETVAQAEIDGPLALVPRCCDLDDPAGALTALFCRADVEREWFGAPVTWNS